MRATKGKTMQTIVIETLVEQLGVDEEQCTPEAKLVDDLGADSLDTIEIIMELEDNLDIEIPDEAADKIKTVQEAVDYLKKATGRE